MEPNKMPFMPEAETAYLKGAYEQARIILEYGSGGSTRLAAQMKGKYVMSVESDIEWTRELRRELTGSRSLVTLLHVDIGETGRWGRPIDDASWRHYHAYPNAIWDKSWFRDPDTILIDGRFRTACLATVLLRTRNQVRVLFDDYTVRPKYQIVERVIKPVELVGRMAVFEVGPNMVRREDIGILIEQYFTVTFAKAAEKNRETDLNPAKRSNEHIGHQ